MLMSVHRTPCGSALLHGAEESLRVRRHVDATCVRDLETRAGSKGRR